MQRTFIFHKKLHHFLPASSLGLLCRHGAVLPVALAVEGGVFPDEVPVAQDGGVAAFVSAPVVARLRDHGRGVEGTRSGPAGAGGTMLSPVMLPAEGK